MRSLSVLPLLLPAGFLSLLGLTMIFSISPDRLILQALFLVTACLVGLGAYRVGFRIWLSTSTLLYATILAALLLTMIFGRVTRGSTRWLTLGPIRLQASEIAKPALLLFLVSEFSKSWPENLRGRLLRLFRVWLTVAPVFLLVFFQPDLGTVLVLGFITLTILLLSSPPRVAMIALGVAFVIIAFTGRFLLADYQLARLQTFLHPERDPRGAGYQVIQSTIAVGSGQFWGRGLGRGTQSQLQFLPERQTDFIFASLVEELGFVGGIITISLYTLFILVLLSTASGVSGQSEFLFLGGMAGWLFFQAMVNIAMNMGVAPVTGITLPFLSAGGSSLVSSAIMLGLAASAKTSV